MTAEHRNRSMSILTWVLIVGACAACDDSRGGRILRHAAEHMVERQV